MATIKRSALERGVAGDHYQHHKLRWCQKVKSFIQICSLWKTWIWQTRRRERCFTRAIFVTCKTATANAGSNQFRFDHKLWQERRQKGFFCLSLREVRLSATDRMTERNCGSYSSNSDVVLSLTSYNRKAQCLCPHLTLIGNSGITLQDCCHMFKT